MTWLVEELGDRSESVDLTLPALGRCNNCDPRAAMLNAQCSMPKRR
jgi:hypothetical protein